MITEEKKPKEDLTNNDSIITKICNFVNEKKIDNNFYLFEIDDLIKDDFENYFFKKDYKNLLNDKKLEILEKLLNQVKKVKKEDYKANENKDVLERVLFRIKYFLEIEIIRKDDSIKKVEFKIPPIPPQTAFKKVGNNKLKINPTGRDYGLLFK